MLYAILAYHVEAEVMSWTPEEDAALMTNLLAVHDRLNAHKLLGPAARLGATAKARTLRGPGAGVVLDGPFAETKEQLLGTIRGRLRQRGQSPRRRPRPAPRQPVGGLRDQADPALSAGRVHSGDREPLRPPGAAVDRQASLQRIYERGRIKPHVICYPALRFARNYRHDIL